MLNSLRKAMYDACVAQSLPTYDYWIVGSTDNAYAIIHTINVDTSNYKLNSVEEYAAEIHIFDKKLGKTATLSYLNAIKLLLEQLDGVNLTFNVRVFTEKEPNVNHGILTVRFTNYN